MLLAVDIGNTNISIGLYCEDKLIFVSRLATERLRMPDQYAAELAAIFAMHSINTSEFQGAIISSVVPELTNVVKEAVGFITEQTPLVLGPGVKTGLNIKIDNPAQLGADLVAGAVGAISSYPLPCLVLDMGTATKISVIDEKGNYRGCTISPGVKLSLNALSAGASQLSSIPLDAPPSAIGTNTISSMQAGIVLGTAAMIEGLCKKIEVSLGEKPASIVATGGIAADIIRYCDMDITLDENLILDGLKAIYNKNTK
ncbi:MAG: type III pantothenate kinase [Clostridia bacterium]|nr:type III pantothenate kinase [Clostridia bacterium]